jgi:uncharacterized protein (DUF983 family)
MKKSNLFVRALKDSCPNCGEGTVFLPSNGLFKLPEMLEKCEKCSYRFDREPGYFIGALYISYGLAVLQGILAFFTCYFFFPSMSTFWQVMFVVGVLILFAKKNYKLARILYIHLFPW